MKTAKLAEDDRRAFDLLLDTGAAATGSSVTRVSRVIAPKRLHAAKRVLAVLGEMPDVEVPAGLAARTLARIEAAADSSSHLPDSVRAVMQLPPA